MNDSRWRRAWQWVVGWMPVTRGRVVELMNSIDLPYPRKGVAAMGFKSACAALDADCDLDLQRQQFDRTGDAASIPVSKEFEREYRYEAGWVRPRPGDPHKYMGMTLHVVPDEDAMFIVRDGRCVKQELKKDESERKPSQATRLEHYLKTIDAQLTDLRKMMLDERKCKVECEHQVEQHAARLDTLTNLLQAEQQRCLSVDTEQAKRLEAFCKVIDTKSNASTVTARLRELSDRIEKLEQAAPSAAKPAKRRVKK